MTRKKPKDLQELLSLIPPSLRKGEMEVDGNSDLGYIIFREEGVSRAFRIGELRKRLASIKEISDMRKKVVA